MNSQGTSKRLMPLINLEIKRNSSMLHTTTINRTYMLKFSSQFHRVMNGEMGERTGRRAYME
jgi:hypothetical protein